MSSRLGPRSRLASRFIFYFAITYLVMIGLMGLIVDRTARGALLEDIDDNLEVAARLVAESVPTDPDDYQSWAETVFDAGGFRVTLIENDGVVVADSHSDPSVMENHLNRPEVAAAAAGDVGRDQRTSASTGSEQRYVAVPVEEDRILRTSVATRVIDDDLNLVRRAILLSALTLGLVGVGLMALVAQRLARPITELTRQARAVAEGDTNVEPRRSKVSELDQLGLAISAMANRLGARLTDAEEATATLGVVLEALPQGTILVADDDSIVYVNPAAREILGTLPDQLSALAPLQFQNAVREARESGHSETRLIDHGSPMRRLRGVATPFQGDQRVLLLVVDVTERERADSIRRDFVANASHELKTPVATIIASAEALQIALERGDGSAESFAGRIETSARQLDRLVADLLDLSRLEKEQPDMAPVRIDRLVRDEVARIRDEAEAKDIAIDFTWEEVMALANHRDIAIAVRNLLDNAVRYTPNEGSIRVEVSSIVDQVQVVITDTGEGIPTRDQERVFERFYRVDSARSRATGGTGLGLSIVKHVAESHGGSVTLESELGVGSKFTVVIPRYFEEGQGQASN